MKLLLITVLVLGIAGFSLTKGVLGAGSCPRPATAISALQGSTPSLAKTEAKGFAVVELFTSEGCSSCPSAEALLGKLAAEKKEHVYVLSYHVDYWDQLGWKDAFSKPEWTARQAAYVNQFKLDGAYTPQAVVNGAEQFVGSNNLHLYTSVDKELHVAMASNLKVAATLQRSNIMVTYEVAPLNDATVNVALVQLKAATDVKRGENKGRHLEHTNVVRDLAIGSSAKQSDVRFAAPANFKAADYKIIAFVQNKKDLKIVTATEAGIQ